MCVFHGNAGGGSVNGNGQPTLGNIAAASQLLADVRPDGFGTTQLVTRDAVYHLSPTLYIISHLRSISLAIQPP